eukprot:CAMPEP_0168524648 /NCGR_PEP_ID=MMETSP0405-20121227/10783_1 /TAXON_ID=498012 /ORGANISM="Trichosphaerium sp, Strain Am-I-7 wt" /LENGTH=477 /DNA_ID=CAMNT_0008546911 /DNA_START=301 /DNA_END=1734 /DNA_ORIENTATION=-
MDPPTITSCPRLSTASCEQVANPENQLNSGCPQSQKVEMLSLPRTIVGGCNRVDEFDFEVLDPCNGLSANCTFQVDRNMPPGDPIIQALGLSLRVPTDPGSVLPCGAGTGSNLHGRPTFFDLCEGVLQGAEFSVQENVDNCTQRINRTFEATTQCNRTTSVWQLLYIRVDDSPPIVTAPPTIMAPGRDPDNLPGPSVLGQANCTDGCPGDLIMLPHVDTVFNMTSTNIVTVQRSFTCMDECGNNGTGFQFILLNVAPEISGDPHFIGFLAQKYDFHGRPDKVFNLITASDIQVNALFLDSDLIKREKLRTYIGTIAIKTSKLRLKIGCNRTEASRFVIVNDEIMRAGEKLTFGQVTIKRSSAENDRTVLSTPAIELSMRFSASTYSSCHINLRSKLISKTASHMHGVLGQTADPETAFLVGEGDQGAGLIEGEWTDYQITGNDLFGDDFVFNEYTGQSMSYTKVDENYEGVVEGWAE